MENSHHLNYLCVFCTENDVSEQTLESYKSKCNEDSPGHEKNGHGKML